MLECKDEGYNCRRGLIFHDENPIQDIGYQNYQQRGGKSYHPELDYDNRMMAYGH